MLCADQFTAVRCWSDAVAFLPRTPAAAYGSLRSHYGMHTSLELLQPAAW